MQSSRLSAAQLSFCRAHILVYFLASHISKAARVNHIQEQKKGRIVSVLYLYKALHWVLEETHFPSLACLFLPATKSSRPAYVVTFFFAQHERARALRQSISKKGHKFSSSPSVRKARSWMRGGCLLICLPAAPHRLEIGYWVKT